jgi:hypothetical protein
MICCITHKRSIVRTVIGHDTGMLTYGRVLQFYCRLIGSFLVNNTLHLLSPPVALFNGSTPVLYEPAKQY